MSVLLTLISHAPTRGEATFPEDEPVDPRGFTKAQALATKIRRVDSTWTSPALRARQTVAALNLDAVVDPALSDIDLGTWAGRSFDEIAATNPEAVAAWTSDCSVVPHSGESILELLDRAAEWLARVARERGRIIAITHAAVVRAAIIVALDAKPSSFWHIDVPPLCRVQLRGDGSRWSLLCMNVWVG